MDQSDWSPSVEFCPLYNDQVVKCRWIKFYINSLSILHLINRVQYVLPSLNWKNERDILKYKVCVFSSFFSLHKNDTCKCRHLIWVIKYFVVKQNFCTSDTAYLTIPISASRAETDPAGLIWNCRADTDSSGVFFFVIKNKKWNFTFTSKWNYERG